MKKKDILTNKNKILFPKSKITKEDLYNYYKKVYKKMIPFLKDRPITLKRFPEGIDGIKFYQKNVSKYFPKWIKTISVKRKGKSSIKMVIINDLKSLLYIVNQVGEIHIWLSKKNKIEYPDKLVFDLDQGSSSFSKVKKAAFNLKKLLESFKLKPYLMTTGSKGLHLVVNIKPENKFNFVKNIAKKIAQMLCEQNKNEYTIELRKNKRKGKVFIDYLRNSLAQTTIAPYSVRAIENAPIAKIIDFKDLDNLKSSRDFTIKNYKTFYRINKKKYSLDSIK